MFSYLPRLTIVQILLYHLARYRVQKIGVMGPPPGAKVQTLDKIITVYLWPVL